MDYKTNMAHSNNNFGSTQDNSATTTTACPVPQACGSRLPCGVCLITNQKCPLFTTAPNITWTSSSANDGLYQPQTGPTARSEHNG